MLMPYLQRIGLANKPEITEAGLIQLHNAQHRTIAFENFDVLAGKPIALDPKRLFHKLVQHKRGGYCFELNGLLFNMLSELGFAVRPLLGRVHLGGQITGRGHLVNLVTLNDKQWLVDVGFGAQTPRAPLVLVEHTEQQIDRQIFRLIKHRQLGWLLQLQEDADWIDLYSVDLSHVTQGDLDYGNFYTSNSPNSIFTTTLIAALATEQGSITLLNNTLKIRQGDSVQTLSLQTETQYLDALKTHFGLEVELPFGLLNRYV